MANSGGAWDNAKKWIEAKGLGEDKAKGTSYHHAAIVGDTVGDPFKDTSGPSLDILIKLMTMMSILFAPIYPEEAFDEDWWWVGLIIFILFMALVIGLWTEMRRRGFGKLTKEENTVGGPEAGLSEFMEAKSESTDKDDGAAGAATTANPTDDKVEVVSAGGSQKDYWIADLKRRLAVKDAELQALKEGMAKLKEALALKDAELQALKQ